jgi:hypothetical protein
MSNEESTKNVEQKVPKKRSPSYPFINLETAVARAQAFFERNEHHWAAPEIAVGFWDYSTKSSGGRQTIAALKHYGLLKSADDGRVALSDRGLDIVMPGSPRRAQALREAALAPDEFTAVWNERGARLGSLDQLKFDLVRNKGFNRNVVDSFLENYRDTIRFAGLEESGRTPPEAGVGKDEESLDGEATPKVPVIGDFVQWTLGGVDQFPKPRRVRALTPDKQWVFVDGSETGLPASEVTVVKAPKEAIMLEAESRTPPPSLPLSVERADTYLLTVPFKGKPLSVRVHLPGEELGSEHFEKVRDHLNLLIDKPPAK